MDAFCNEGLLLRQKEPRCLSDLGSGTLSNIAATAENIIEKYEYNMVCKEYQ